MIVEVRSYRIKPGHRAEFIHYSKLERAGFTIAWNASDRTVP